MSTSIGLAVALTACLVLLAGCGSSSQPQGPGGPQPGSQALPPVPDTHGAGMPAAAPDNFDAENSDKWPSATYRKFFLDSVNHQSNGRWTVTDDAGKKAWTLSNTCYSAPKSWLLGGNYWNHEDDELNSTPFTVQANQDGIRLSFYARWKIAANDSGEVWYWDGDSWEFVTGFSGGQNADYPNWTKYYFELPANGVADSTCGLNFAFNSDGSGTDWGFAFDSVAVYQTQLNPPVNVDASDGGLPGEVVVNWDHSVVGTLTPEWYDIWRADSEFGSYTLDGSVAYPAQAYSDMSGNGATYWYKVTARRAGWPNSPESNADNGFGEGIWTVVNITSNAELDGSNSSLAIINGNPAVAWRRSSSGGGVAYSRSSTVDGLLAADWSAPVFVDTGDTGFGNSLHEVAGRPAVVYSDITSGEFLYARAADANGTDWNGLGSTGFILDNGGGTNVVGGVPTLRVSPIGLPVAVYTDFTANAIKWANASTAAGDNQLDWTKYVIYDGTAVLHPTLDWVDGNAAVTFAETNGTGKVSYTRADSSTPAVPASWPAPVAVITGLTASNTGLFVCNGKPGVTYLDGNSDVFFARSGTNTGDLAADWLAGSNVNVDINLAENYDGTRGAFLLGLPRIAYYNVASEDIMVARGNDANGETGGTWVTQLVDGTGTRRGEPCTPILVDGHIALTYRNYNDDDLMYALYQ